MCRLITAAPALQTLRVERRRIGLRDYTFGQMSAQQYFNGYSLRAELEDYYEREKTYEEILHQNLRDYVLN